MNEFDNMIKIGELADKKITEQIVSEMLRRNIHLEKVYDSQNQMFVLYARDEESATIAFDYYRVKVGFAPPPKPMPKEWESIKNAPLGKVTIVFLAISIFVYLSRLFMGDTLFELFFMSNHQTGGLSEIKNGEFWRIFTPVFLHFNLLHILFNGMWMKDLGSLIEHHKGKIFYITLILISGLLSNIGQYYVKGPFFGGLSGIVYALLGFVWMNKKFFPEVSYSLPKNDVLLMIGWFFFCFTGVLGPIANTAHGIGLAIGMIFGVFSGSFSNQKFDSMNMLGYCLLALIFGAGTFAFEFYVLPMITGS